ncbi:MAG TPA: transporter substrate-binding domain-containing protein, partial [Burkholderiales bacterium]
DPYMAYRSVLVVRKEEAPVRSLADLARGPVAVQSGSWAHYQFTQHGIKVWVRFRTDEDIIQAVENGDAHAGVVSNFGYEWYVHGHPQAAMRAATEFGFDPDFGYDVAVGLMEADAALLERVNAALAQMRENGTISQVLSRYGITALPPGDGAQ